uniref:Uncharacterized protein n=1 Tax=Anguilla anguilla TaxID=7936 RepID=A0A0E9TVH7_ANGAN
MLLSRVTCHVVSIYTAGYVLKQLRLSTLLKGSNSSVLPGN